MKALAILSIAAAAVVGLTSPPTANAAIPPPALTIADTLGNSVTVDSTGTATCAGICSGTSSVSPGFIYWTGIIGNFTVNVELGESKPILKPPQIQVSFLIQTGDTGGTITTSFTDAGFDGLGPVMMQAADTLAGSVNATYSGYVDNTNAAFGTGTLVGTFTHTGLGGADTITGPGPTVQPYSMTTSVTAAMGPNSGFSLAGLNMLGTAPPPLALTCAGGTGQVGAPYNSALMASGGVPPYTYSIVSGMLPDGLTLNPTTGAITGTPTQATTYGFTAQVTDSNVDTTSNKVQQTCMIVISPPPPLTLLCAKGTGQVNQPYASALVAGGGVPPYTFAITAGSLPPGLTLDTILGNITGVPTTAGTYNFTAQVKDSTGTMAGTVAINCSIVIAPPPLSLLCAGGTGQVGVPYNSALSASGGVPGYTYSITSGSLPTGLSLNMSTGAISGTPTTAGTFNFTAQVIDSSGNPATNTISTNCSIVIAPAPLALLCAGGTGQVNVPYSSALVASGGVPGYTYSISSGSLPGGLTLNPATGAISGTPTTAGTFNFTAKAVDSSGNPATNSITTGCSIVIAPPPPPPSKPQLDCVTCSSILGFVGKDYSASENVTGGVAPYTFQIVSGNLPPGMTLDSSTGVLSGTPTQPGLYVFTTKVTDSAGNTDTAICLIIILKSPVQLNCGACGSNPGAGQVGVTYTDQLTVNGGKPQYTFTLVSGSLPPGLTLSQTTGTITGKPTTAGTYTFTIKVVDSNGFSDTATCKIVVKSPIDLNCGACGSTAGSGQTGSSYTDQLTVTGGVMPYTFSIISGSLPPGLTLNTSTGKISGTPTTPGTYTFTAKVVDSHGNSDTATCTINIKGSLIDLECGACGTGGKATVGIQYTDALTVKNGYGPYTFSIVSGSLPPGMTLNTSTGNISGTPTMAGTYTFTAKVVDYRHNSDTVDCTITVVTAPLDVTCGTCSGSAGTAWLGTPYTDALIATGGTPGYTFSIISGSLPSGLSLNSSTGNISGTPTKTGTFGFTVKVVDSKGKSDTTTCAITVKASPIDLNCGACGGVNGQAKVGNYYVDQLTVSHGTAPYTFSIISGKLAPGLSLNQSTGKISGSPTTSGTYTFTAQVVDGKGYVDTVSCTIVVSKSW